MTTVARLLLSSLAGVFAVVLGTSVAAACSCAELTTAEHVENADVVARVIVERIDMPDERGTNTGDPAIYTVRPTHVWKGDVADTFSIATASSGASCGLEGFREGSDIVLFATYLGDDLPVDTDLSADLCGGTAVASDPLVAEVTSLLGEGKPVELPPPDDAAAECICEEMSTAEHAAAANLIARVVVERVNLPVPGTTDGQPATYTMRPTYVWKGNVVSQFKVASEPSGKACGLEGIVEGQDLVLFANDTGNGWSATQCGGTTTANETLVAELLEVVGPGVAPNTNPDGQPGAWVWPTVAATASVLLLGYIVTRWWIRPRKQD